MQRPILSNLISGIAVAAALVGPGAAYAQITALNPTTMIGYAGTAAAGTQARRSIGSRIASRRALPIAARSAPAATATSFAYQPEAGVRQQVYDRAVANARKANPADAAKLKQVLDSGAMRKEVAGYLSKYGMSANNVADTTALYLATAWLATRASAADPTPAQMRGLRTQVASVMAGMPDMASASNSVKQEIAEANILQASFASLMANRAAADPKLAPQVRSAVIKGVQSSYQMDLGSLELTNDGLR